ncbi:unnamed protein product [Caenorhabditis auriculariae]|uniref:Endonuclease/exonuclease/phosphatase domain-containing protein n=1 Tax=Caenorhabditis auriculariae TaxID=2777116 RepID=A0A8S1GRK4_9PELO|nr:unnamed protein product [Caenorhabditis auriculariae]
MILLRISGRYFKERRRSRLPCNRSVQHLVDSHEIVNARLGILRLNLGKRERLTIINVYSPTSSKAESTKAKREEKEKELDDFYRKLEETIQREKAYYIFVLGDFNAMMGKYATPSIRHGQHGLGTRNDNGERLADLLDSRRLYHGNSLFEKPDQRRWTWKSANGNTTNEIDHILTNRKWSLLDVAVLPSFDVGSDHRLVRAKVRLNQKFLKKDYHQRSRPRRPTYDIITLEIGRRRRAGWAAFNSIKEVTRQLKDPNLRAHIFEASIILRTSYRALERALLGTTRFEQWKKEQRGTDLRQLSQTRDQEEHIQRGKHRWGGHVIRRQDDRCAHSGAHRPDGRTTSARTSVSQAATGWPSRKTGPPGERVVHAENISEDGPSKYQSK